MTNSLEQHKDLAQKSVKKIMEHTGGDGAAIIVIKEGGVIVASEINGIQHSMLMMEAAEKLRKAIADDALAKLENEVCNCPKCRAKREKNTSAKTVH